MTMNRRFGELLAQGVRSVANRTRETKQFVEEGLGRRLGYDRANIVRWQRGYVPRDPAHVEICVRYCLEEGFVGREWAERILSQAKFEGKEALLADLFAARRSRPGLHHIYHNLPTLHGEIIGREKDFARTLRAILSRYPLISIEGMGGVGKTTLSIMIGRACLPGGSANLPKPFEACVFVSARDGLTLPELCDKIGQVLNYPRVSQNTPVEDKPNEVYKILAQHRVLLIVDNLETVDENDEVLFSFLQDVPEPTKVLLTTRWVQVWRAVQIPLKGLEPEPAKQLIHTHLTHLGLGEESWVTEENCLALAETTGGNPYAIEVSLGYLKYGFLTLPELVNELYKAGRDVEEIFEYIFQHAWDEVLTETTQNLLLVMPFFVDSVSLEALGASAGVEGYFLKEAVKQLMQMSLLQRAGDKRYVVHPLTRAFAGRQLASRPGWEQPARQRWLNHCLHIAETYGGEDYDDWERYNRLELDIHTLQEATHWAFNNDELDAGLCLLKHIKQFLFIRGAWQSLKEMAILAVQFTREHENYEPQLCYWLEQCSWVLGWQNSGKQAEDLIQEALTRRIRLNDLKGQQDSMRTLGIIQYRQGYWEIAEQTLKESLHLAQQLDLRREIISAWYHLGYIALHNQKFEAAVEWFEKTQKYAFKAGLVRAYAYAHNWLADIEIRRGNYSKALLLLEEGFPVAENFKDQLRIAFFKKSFATLAYHEGNVETGNCEAHEALDLFSRLGMKQEVAEVEQLIEQFAITEPMMKDEG